MHKESGDIFLLLLCLWVGGKQKQINKMKTQTTQRKVKKIILLHGSPHTEKYQGRRNLKWSQVDNIESS